MHGLVLLESLSVAVLIRPLVDRAGQVELDGQVNGRMLSLTCVLQVRMGPEPQSQKADLHF